jgi:hypothetical protein
MYAHVVSYPSLHARRRRPIFLGRTTQHVPSLMWVREVARALLALGNVVLWAGILLAL